MTNPNNAIGTNGAFGGRTSVNAFNDGLSAWNRGVMSGWACVPDSGMTVAIGGDPDTRDVAVAEDDAGNKTSINNISMAPVKVTIPGAPASNTRIDSIVAYVDNPPQGSSTITDNYEACGIIVVSGTASSSPTAPNESAIRSAITADGATGATAYYVVLANVSVANGTTDITSGEIMAGDVAILSAQGIIRTANVANGSVTSEKIAGGAVTANKIDLTTLNPIFSAITLSGTYGDSSASANSQIAMDAVKAVFGSKLTMSGNAVKIGSGVSRVLVTAGVFYSGSTSSSYGWCRVDKNNSDTGFTAIAYKSTSSYGSAVVPLFVLDVQENDIISLYNLEASTVRGTASYLTVLAIG